MNTDYSIEALEILLNEDCLAERYYPLIQYKGTLIQGLRQLNCQTKKMQHYCQMRIMRG